MEEATFRGARSGEHLHISAGGVTLVADGERRWHAPFSDIRSVLAVRRVRERFVDDAIHICTRDGRDRHFLVASTAVRDDYGAEFSEAVADAVATSVRRAAGLA